MGRANRALPPKGNIAERKAGFTKPMPDVCGLGDTTFRMNIVDCRLDLDAKIQALRYIVIKHIQCKVGSTVLKY